MKIDDLLIFCQNMEQDYKIKYKRYDDASGYTRSGNKDIRTSDAIIAETYSNYYQQIAKIIKQYKKINDIMKSLTPEDKDIVENMFYTQMTLEDIHDNFQQFNNIVSEIKSVLRGVNENDNE